MALNERTNADDTFWMTSEVHNLAFGLHYKIQEEEPVGILKSNLNPYLLNKIFALRMDTLADLKSECRGQKEWPEKITRVLGQ
ncbi:unnamed protein product [Ceratitis capitata]|uniref:(Mediterranean fruit fly) hypothetical protein n=1 Tax=Ceratitis capitata TaxID=7213 RepID=A0A811UQU4_CERCA|nr:unnamed protein product [Ceratitis capitata]